MVLMGFVGWNGSEGIRNSRGPFLGSYPKGGIPHARACVDACFSGSSGIEESGSRMF